MELSFSMHIDNSSLILVCVIDCEIGCCSLFPCKVVEFLKFWAEILRRSFSSLMLVFRDDCKSGYPSWKMVDFIKAWVAASTYDDIESF